MLSVLTVTYADRWIYLTEVLKFLEASKEVDEIVVVNNEATYSVQDWIAQQSFRKVYTINIPKNVGASGGYKAGLQFLLSKPNTQFIYLLDDDNLPELDAIPSLMNKWKSIHHQEKENHIALYSLRTDRKYLQLVARGAPVRRHFPTPNAFLGFNLFSLHKIFVYKRFGSQLYQEKNSLPRIQIPMAPYGGLFFHKDIINTIGFPDERFFVYGDDFEFTYRITKKGGAIFMIPGSRVNDIEPVWLNQERHSLFRSRYLSDASKKIYFSVRNITYFTYHQLATNKVVYRFNQSIYLLYLRLLAIFAGRMKAFNLFHQAVKDGMNGKFDNYKVF